MYGEKISDIAVKLFPDAKVDLPEGGIKQFKEEVKKETKPTNASEPSSKSNEDVSERVENKVLKNSDGKPLTVYHSTFNDFNDFNDGITYFAEDADYSRKIATTMNREGKGKDEVETREIRTIPVNIESDRVYELPQGTEMNANVIKGLMKDPEFAKKYDVVKGIDLYSDDKVVYAVLDKSKIKKPSELVTSDGKEEKGLLSATANSKVSSQIYGNKLNSEPTPERSVASKAAQSDTADKQKQTPKPTNVSERVEELPLEAKVKYISDKTGVELKKSKNTNSWYGSNGEKAVRISDHPSKFTERGAEQGMPAIDLNLEYYHPS